MITCELNTGWQFRQCGKKEWFSADIPGCVHTDLIKHKLIDDPFYRDNENNVQWIDKQDWEYWLHFDLPVDISKKQHIALVCDGLDTYASVKLNNKEIIEANNMFHPWIVNVKSLLKETGNQLYIKFRSPVNEILPKLENGTNKLPAMNDLDVGTNPYTRKAAYHYQWDWGPRLITSGIWQPIRLEGWDEIKITDLNIITKKLENEKAELEVAISVLSEITDTAKIKLLEDRNHTSIIKKLDLKKGLNEVSYRFEINNPELWWPAGYGEQPLYNIQIEIETANDSASDSKRIGLRTIELKRENDEWGESFAFVVNNVPIFAKGANWIPSDNFTNRVTEEKYRYLLNSTVDANMNMLRIWGGGIYENEIFYDLCDEMGILVWQDFMFACAMYPANDDFLNSVRKEAVYQVRRLRNHPCIVLWCGNNEIEAAWKEWGMKKKYPDFFWDDYLKLFTELLYEVCQQEDPTRSYWSTSPGSAVGESENPGSGQLGDTHLWSVWHGKEPFEFYHEQNSRFVSEYGFQSFPVLKSVEKFAEPEDYDIFSQVMLNHQKNSNGNALIKNYMEQYYLVPEKFENFLFLSQTLQAEGIKTGAEHFRRTMPQCMGSLYWQLNDCWPVASWASIDYYGDWKALHYYAKNFYAPILVSVKENDSDWQVYVVSDKINSQNAKLNIRFMDFSGKILFQKSEKIQIKPLKSEVYFSLKKEKINNFDPATSFIYCSIENHDQILSENSFYLKKAKDQKLMVPKINTEFLKSDEGYTIQIHSENLVRSVILVVNEIEGQFDDNFFDLYPGQKREIHFKTSQKLEQADFENMFSIVTLYELMGNA